MKKLIVITSLFVTLAGSVFGQGYFVFSGVKSQVWDCFTGPAPRLDTSVNVAFLWGPSTATPLVDSLMGSTPTNGVTPPFDLSTAWTDILLDPNFHFATNASSSFIAVTATSNTGSIGYNDGAYFPVLGTTAEGTYAVFMISWDAAYADPVAASQGVSPLGWGSVFTYGSAALTSTPNAMNEPDFGTIGVPEPAALALAGLGAFALLLFRRCRQS